MESGPDSGKNVQWQRAHYAIAGRKYGDKHFTRPDGPYTRWIVDRIASVCPDAEKVAEVGAGTCVFASLLGEKMRLDSDVVCYEPVKELLEASARFDNVDAKYGSAIDFAHCPLDETFDFVFTKDTAHHFPADTLDEVHNGICCKLKPGGRYLMVVRAPPQERSVPVGSIAKSMWAQVYTSRSDLLASMRQVADWTEIQVTQWRFEVETSVEDWIDGVRNRDTWSIFSALDSDEVAQTVEELEAQFDGAESFDFLHQYDVAIFEKPGPGAPESAALTAPQPIAAARLDATRQDIPSLRWARCPANGPTLILVNASSPPGSAGCSGRQTPRERQQREHTVRANNYEHWRE